MPARDLARDVGVVLQERPGETSFTVHEMVLMGRGPHKKLLARDTAKDLEIVASALSRVGIASLAQRPFESLSGGEKQRVIIARALAQTPRAPRSGRAHDAPGHRTSARDVEPVPGAEAHDPRRRPRPQSCRRLLRPHLCPQGRIDQGARRASEGLDGSSDRRSLRREGCGRASPSHGTPARVRAWNGGCQSDMLGWHFALGAHEGITGKPVQIRRGPATVSEDVPLRLSHSDE